MEINTWEFALPLKAASATVQQNIAKAKTATSNLPIRKLRSFQAVRSVYRTFILPILEYGIRILPCQPQEFHQLDRAQAFILAQLCGSSSGSLGSSGIKELHAALPNFAERCGVLRLKYLDKLAPSMRSFSFNLRHHANTISQSLNHDPFVASFQISRQRFKSDQKRFAEQSFWFTTAIQKIPNIRRPTNKPTEDGWPLDIRVLNTLLHLNWNK